LVEAEIWPNFLLYAHHRRTPVFLVNARLSERSYRGYKLFARFLKPVFASFAGVSVPTEADAARLRELGCRPETVHVLGNLKFDAAKLDERRLLDVPALLGQIGVPEGAEILVGGSTHAGEEAILADLFLRLKKRFPDLFLVLVPRHFERGKEVGRELAARGVKFVYRSELSVSRQYPPGSVECLLVNSTGELKYFYEQATVIFIGKSLTAKGGQNPIEPGALGKAMVFGPNMQNFAAIAATFVGQHGAVQVRSVPELENAIGTLLADSTWRQELGKNALKVVQANRGAIEHTVQMILERLQRKEVYIADAASGQS
jgi:3-deoxy-D-manno-octulosonic-acid transferase